MKPPPDDLGPRTTEVPVWAVDDRGGGERKDTIAVEEPMEIRVATGPMKQRAVRAVSVTMRTPGHDFELALGFLFGEGLLHGADEIISVDFAGPPAPDKAHSNVVRVELHPDVELDVARLERNFYATSSCGICGKASLDAIDFEGFDVLDTSRPRVEEKVLHTLPDALREAQVVFDMTGGLHAAGLFDADGSLIDCREDVGRHNAVDKLIGAQLMKSALPLDDKLLVVSGRVSFEILQKALAASVGVVVAVGAPSSLAVEMAQRFGQTLVGFARDRRFNVYAGRERIV